MIEIGSGPGGLTRALLAEEARRVIAIERDARCLAALQEIAAAYPGRLQLVPGDALDIGFNVNYLLDVLNNVPGAELECAFGDASSSALISYASEQGFKYVVMPMRI